MLIDHPSLDAIKSARVSAGLTQEEAGAVVKSARRTWQDWERGRRKMPAGLFDLFKPTLEITGLRRRSRSKSG